MFEFQVLCNEVEALTPEARAALIAERAVAVVQGLRKLDFPVDPVEVLVSFVIGSVVSDGSISEKDYLKIHPSLEKAFGDLCDLAGIEHTIKVSRDVRKVIENVTKELLALLGEADETLAMNIVSLCLLVTSVDGKISLKERRYIKQLCKG